MSSDSLTQVSNTKDEVQTNQTVDTPSSAWNVMDFAVTNIINSKINTAIPVRVDTCTTPGPKGAAGYVTATPLVKQRAADGNSLEPVSLPKLPFFRMQCGTAALVCDPRPGDVGLAVFAQQDASALRQGRNQPVQAGSHRSFSMSDGFYIGGFINKAPRTYIHLDPDNDAIEIVGPRNITLTASESIKLHAGKSIEFSAGETFLVNAGKRIVMDAGDDVTIHSGDTASFNAEHAFGMETGSKVEFRTPLVEMAGAIRQSGELSGGGPGLTTTGGIQNSGGKTISNAVTVETHTHGGVDVGSGSTASPNSGT